MAQALRHDYRPSRDVPPHMPPEPIAPLPPSAVRRTRWQWLLGIGGLLTIIPIGISLNALNAPVAPPATLAPVKRHAITALGWLEPSSDIVKLAAPATVESSRVARLEVREGDLVEAGQIIAVLDVEEKLRAQLRTAEAQVALKRALVERVRLDTETSIVSRRMAVARAQADLDQSEAEFARQKALLSREISTPANLEKKKRDRDVAQAQIEEARSALEGLGATTSLDDTASERIDIVVAKRELAAAEADLAQVRILLDQASIRSPIGGRVLVVHTRPGEKISSDGVVELGATQAMVAIAEVYQSDIGLIHVGQPVELRSEAFEMPATGVVERVGLKVKRQSVINNDPATDTDARVIEVRVALDAASSARVSNLTRLQVRAHFKLEVQ